MLCLLTKQKYQRMSIWSLEDSIFIQCVVCSKSPLKLIFIFFFFTVIPLSNWGIFCWKPSTIPLISPILLLSLMFARKDGVLKTIWKCRNGLRFKKIATFINSEIIGICSSVSLIGNLTKLAIGLFMLDFTVLETFKLQTHPPKTSQIKEVIWCPPKPP